MRNWFPLHSYPSYIRFKRTGVVRASPPVVLACGFLTLIALGTLFLMLPAAAQTPIGAMSALFMATSAVTITGLGVVDPGTDLTTFGQVVLMVLVQLGGLGYVTFAVVSAITLGKRMSLQHQALALEAFNQTSVSKVRNTAFLVLRTSVLVELSVATILAIWWSRDFPWMKAVYYGVFHAVTAFNNSGLSLFSDSLARFVDDPVTVFTITAAIILGGIGFTVIGDLCATRSWSRLRPYTRTMIVGTVALNLFGFLAILALEHTNPATLGHLSWYGQALAAWTQSVVTRTAGFSSIDISQIRDSSALVMMFLMFIGGGSLSLSGGIKVGTFIVLLAAVRAYVFHRQEVVLFNRTISSSTVQKSLALLLINVVLVFTGTLLMTIFEKAHFVDLLFEVVSALSTTGLSRGITASLSAPGQIVLVLLMFAGRVGPLTLAYSIATQRRSRVRYPEAEFQVG